MTSINIHETSLLSCTDMWITAYFDVPLFARRKKHFFSRTNVGCKTNRTNHHNRIFITMCNMRSKLTTKFSYDLGHNMRNSTYRHSIVRHCHNTRNEKKNETTKICENSISFYHMALLHITDILMHISSHRIYLKTVLTAYKSVYFVKLNCLYFIVWTAYHTTSH